MDTEKEKKKNVIFIVYDLIAEVSFKRVDPIKNGKRKKDVLLLSRMTEDVIVTGILDCRSLFFSYF